MWHGYVNAETGSQIYAKGKPRYEGGGVITAKTRKELFLKLDKAARDLRK